MDAQYITSAARGDQLPAPKAPEVAFFGRSNVGKSTLLNALAGRKGLARTSNTPGRTQMANFFSVRFEGGHEVTMVDLPGYGFAQAGAAVRKNWENLVGAYLERENIKLFIMLLDSRRALDDDGLDPVDGELLNDLSRRGPVLLALTKTDKLSQRDAQMALKKTRETVKGLATVEVMLVSAEKQRGIPEIRKKLLAAARES
ncbi:ribosome biogenesis GTP-binding protein YsxC [bacterium]|nr:ribosome biogenesis GTP-binding protein YsxC [bacterium]